MTEDDQNDLDEETVHAENTFLTFHVHGEEYAVPVVCVTEIVRLQKMFVVPDVPTYIRGVINLRGKVIPLLDVRTRFHLAQAEYTDRTVVVVLEVGDSPMGLIVDGVSEVIEIPPDQIELHSGISKDRERALVKALGKRAAGVSFILDVAALLDVDGKIQPPAAGQAPSAH